MYLAAVSLTPSSHRNFSSLVSACRRSFNFNRLQHHLLEICFGRTFGCGAIFGGAGFGFLCGFFWFWLRLGFLGRIGFGGSSGALLSASERHRRHPFRGRGRRAFFSTFFGGGGGAALPLAVPALWTRKLLGLDNVMIQHHTRLADLKAEYGEDEDRGWKRLR